MIPEILAQPKTPEIVAQPHQIKIQQIVARPRQSNQKSIQNLLSDLGKSMATALYTTLVGLICGQLLKLQTFIFSLHLNKLERDEDKKTV
jgi:hypothetical protein